MIHNGIVENFEALRARYLDRGADFASETDSEVIAHMLAERLDRGSDLAEALRSSRSSSKGRTLSWPSRPTSRAGWWRRASATPAAS